MNSALTNFHLKFKISLKKKTEKVAVTVLKIYDLRGSRILIPLLSTIHHQNSTFYLISTVT